MGLKTKLNKKLTFFYVVMFSAIIIISVVAVQTPKKILNSGASKDNISNLTYAFDPGWSGISIPFETNLTAKDFCLQVNSAVSVANWNNSTSTLEYYDCATSDNKDNFVLSENVGYFVRVENSSIWEVSGIVSKGKQYIPLTEGWNLVGLASISSDYSDLESVCEGKLTQGSRASISEIDRWVSGGWESHVCSLPFNNFNINSGEAYFVFVKVDSNSNAPKLPKLKLM